MRRLLTTCCAAAALALFPRLSPAVVHDVEIHDNFFSPAAITVAEGDSVRWTHLGVHPHTVDQSDLEGSCDSLVGGFSSGMMMNGDSFIWVAAGLGDAYYHCAFHCPPMMGEVTVQDSTPVDGATWGTVKALYR